jgi:hypothetical protein
MMTGEEIYRQRGDQMELSIHGMAGAVTTVRLSHPNILDGKS